MKKSITVGVIILLSLLITGGIMAKPYLRSVYYRIRGQKTVDDVINSIENDVKNKLDPEFNRAGVSFPPKRITFIALKQERELELWVDENNEWVYVKTYPILGLSGKSGPKLKEGDRQVPEGIYKIAGLNPNSYYHLAMLISYPNDFDKEKAKKDNRTNLGGDICIHGSNASAGCLAMGDEASEELFYLAVKGGIDNVKVIILPYDFRKEKNKIETEDNNLEWLPELYDIINDELKEYKN
ncbi:MAG TPA: L,D-transpeptidase family protein [Acetivibrio sp.]|nr:L,D-transpeptidase family protein [Acetivibrio sp.]